MKSKLLIGIIPAIMGVVLLVSAFTGGFMTGRVFNAETASQAIVIPGISDSAPDAAEAEQTGSGSQDQEKLFRSFWQAWDIVHEEYVDQPVDDTKLMRGAISGML